MMKTCKMLITVLGVALISCGAHGAMPAVDFACQVEGRGGLQGLVWIQADNKAQAREAAVGARASMTNGEQRTALAVLECIRWHEESFRDAEFHRFAESIPR